jgi:branched-chain amino acid transport system substrate-binding protein
MFGRVISTALIGFFAAIGFIAHAQPGAALTIGFVVDRNGPWVNASKDFFAGAKTQIEELNSRGGINGRPVRIVQRDTDGSAQRALEAALELARNDHVDVILGLAGDAALAAIASSAELQKEGVALVGPMSGLTAGANTQVLFTRPDYARETQRILQHLKGFGLAEVAMMYGPSAYAPAAAAIRQGLSVSSDMRITEYGLSLQAAQRDKELRAVAVRKPQAVVVIGDSLEFAELYQAYRRLAPGALIIGLSSVNPRTILEVVPPQQMGGAMVSQVMIDPIRQNQALTRELDKAFKKYFDEQPSHQTLEGYVAARVVLEAAKRAGKPLTRANLLAALQNQTRIDVAGFELDYAKSPQRGSQFVDLVMMRADGSLMQ